MKALIWDPAHGKETPGKRSPDGKHREYLWSRTQLIKIVNKLLLSDYFTKKVDVFFPYVQLENEIPRLERVRHYNDIAAKYDNTLMISLHNDAEDSDNCNSEGWGRANGAAVWTSKGQDNSDKIATDWFGFVQENRSDIYLRKRTYDDGDPDYEANFTIIAGYGGVKPKYDAILIEWLFQTNYIDVQALLDDNKNAEFVDMMVNWLFNLYL